MTNKGTHEVRQICRQDVEVDKDGNEQVIGEKHFIQREIVEGCDNLQIPKKYRLNNGSYILLFQSVLNSLAEDVTISRSETRVLLSLMGSAGVDGSISLDLGTLSKKLHLSKSSVSLAIKGLVQRNLIVKRDGSRYDRSPLSGIPHVNYDQLNYRFAYNGRIKEFGNKKYNHPEIEMPCGDHQWVDIKTGVVETD